MGVESADADVLRRIGKGISPAEIMDAIAMLLAHGIRADTSLIIGHPFDTRETIEKTVIFATVIRQIGTAALGISTPYPGTQLYREAEKLGLRIMVKNWRKYDTLTPIYETANFHLNDLRRAYYLFDRCRATLRARPILTDNRHEDYWTALQAWADNLLQLKARAWPH
jgi:radical SAM superfamily enzyme YgiQ (UPF0313 family)